MSLLVFPSLRHQARCWNMFASQDSNGMLSFIGMTDQCLKAGKKQAWHEASVTNICVRLLSGLKTLLAQRPEPLAVEILSAAQAIFQSWQSILAEGIFVHHNVERLQKVLVS